MGSNEYLGLIFKIETPQIACGVLLFKGLEVV